ncbi:hypothetical protein V2J09_012414 [Rumex salicifolius]
MASSILRSQSSILRLLNTQNLSPFKSVSKDPFPPYRLQCHQQRLRFSNFFKRGKEFEAAAPNFIPSSLGSTSFRKIRFVSWYLGMTIAMSSSGTYDYLRTLRMAGYGFILLGPTLHFWFNLMSRFFPGRDLLSTAKKMALGQSVYGPLMTITFFTMNAALQGEHYTAIVSRLRRDLLPTLLNGIMYWPVCDFITFRFVPVHLQPLVSNGFSYIWTIYLTYMASLEKAI